MTIAALRKIQDEATTVEEPTPVRPAPAKWPTATAPAAEEKPQPLPVGKLLTWGEHHADPGVEDQAARARVLLGALQQRHAADQELAAITSETAQLEKRLAELRAREAELAPAKKAKSSRKPVDYPAAEVRAWAAANGRRVSPVGRIPKPVVDAWRAATGHA